jgi:antagonist of KipI
MPALRVIKAGMLTTVQDLGRWGFQARGVPVGGPMDPVSHRVANALVGNPADCATLEVTLLGPEIEFEDARTVAVAGGQFDVSVDGESVPTNTAVPVRAGGRLKVGGRRRGARAYIAIAGGIDTPLVLGSRATHLLSAMGGLDGRALRAGDRLPLGTAAGPQMSPHRAARLSGLFDRVPDSGRPAIVRVLPGPQADRFTDEALDVLQSAPYVVGEQSNRMGFRLEGPRLPHRTGADIISDATPLGVLQVPASGQPILLMADRQTAGGYPKLATVITADIGIAGQLGAGDSLRFVVCSRREALAALIAQERALMAVETASARSGGTSR